MLDTFDSALFAAIAKLLPHLGQVKDYAGRDTADCCVIFFMFTLLWVNNKVETKHNLFRKQCCHNGQSVI